MGILLQVTNASKGFASKTLFQRANFTVNENEHIGVIGPNGAGKTTLFKILAGLQEFDSGSVVPTKNCRLAYLAQEELIENDLTVDEYIEHKTTQPLWETKSQARHLGLSEEYFQKKLKDLSGGYQMRCKLLALLGQNPNLLLLDEPTNYLDLETVLVLEKFLLGFKGSFLLISHDREFLRCTTDHILEIEEGDFSKFNGNIDDFFEQKALLREHLMKQAFNQEAKQQEIKKFADRFRAKASKARQVQSRLKLLDKMGTIEVKSLPVKAKIQIPKPYRTGKEILQTNDVTLGYGDLTVLKNVNIEFGRGDHVAIVGINGAGKSTLLKGLGRNLKPLKGEIFWGPKVKVGYYAQHVADELIPDYSVYDAMISKAHKEVLPQEVKDLAGCLLFSGDDIRKKIKVLSGGEKARVALGQILLQKAPCLLLDEPTNHLDFHTVEALTQALEKYQGTLVIVSHDRGFIRRVATKILEIHHGRVELYSGSYEEYVWSLQKGSLSKREIQVLETASGESKHNFKPSNYLEQKQKRKNTEKSIRHGNKKIEQLDQEMETYKQKLAEINEKILTVSGHDAIDLAKTLHTIQENLNKAEEQWLEIGDKLSKWQEELKLLKN